MNYGIEIDEVLNTLMFYENRENWPHVLKILCRYKTFFDFMEAHREADYLKKWQVVCKQLGVDMESELEEALPTWFSPRSSEEFRCSREARMGAYLRQSGCCGDLTLTLSERELELVEGWFDEPLMIRAHRQLGLVYSVRNDSDAAELHLNKAKDIQAQYNNDQVVEMVCTTTLGVELFESELLSVTHPVFMDAIERDPAMSLERRYEFWRSICVTAKSVRD
jgi:hypothetical protein